MGIGVILVLLFFYFPLSVAFICWIAKKDGMR